MPGLSTDKQPGDVKVEMFGIETTEIISAHEHYKNPGRREESPTPRLPSLAQTCSASVELNYK